MYILIIPGSRLAQTKASVSGHRKDTPGTPGTPGREEDHSASNSHRLQKYTSRYNYVVVPSGGPLSERPRVSHAVTQPTHTMVVWRRPRDWAELENIYLVPGRKEDHSSSKSHRSAKLHQV